MKRISKLLIIAIFCGLTLNSCSSEDENIDPIEPRPEETYTNGFFVLNEGNSGGGSVTFIGNDLQKVEQQIYQRINEGEDLGQFLQSIFFNENLAYIISNKTNLITVVDRYTFELVGKVDSGLQVPRYGVVENGKAYVTNQGSFEDPGVTEFDDYIAVIDLETLEVEENIELHGPAEYIKGENGLLYIQNATYGVGNKISVVDPETNAIIKTIETNTGLTDFAIEEEFIYALSASQLEKIDINSGNIISTVAFPEASASKLELENDMIYYNIGNSVYMIQENAETAPEEALFSYTSNSDYGKMYGFDVENDRIYIADGGDFASNSFVEIYTTSGEFLENFEVGVAPNGFYFNE